MMGVPSRASRFRTRTLEALGLEVPHADSRALDRDDLDSVESDRVRPVGRAGAEDTLLSVQRIPARVHPQHVAPCPIEPGQDDDVGAALEVTDPLAHHLLEYEPGIGRSLVALLRSQVAIHQGRLDPSDRP